MDKKMDSSEKSLSGIIDLFEQTFAIFKDNFKVFIPISSIFIIVFVSGVLIFGMLFASIALLSGILPEKIILMFIIAISFFLILILLPAYSWIYASLVSAVKNLNEKDVISNSLKEGFSLILLFLILFVAYGTLVTFGFVLLIIPGILFYTWYFFFPYVVVFERLGDNTLKDVFNSLSRSKTLVTGYFLPVFARLFMLWLFSSLAETLLSFIPLGILLFFVCYLPFKTIFGYLLYRDLKRIKNQS